MKKIFKSKHVVLYFGKGFNLSFQLCGYFDNRPRINIHLFFFGLELILPFRNKLTDECIPPQWGIAHHHQTLWIYKGNQNLSGNWYAFSMPWMRKWVRTSALRQDGFWEHETKNNTKNFWDNKWKSILWHKTYPYTYVLKSGVVQKRQATVKVEEREWRMNWFTWLPFNRRIQRTIDVEFNDEVGERTGSWKGGTLGCGYLLRPDETPLKCLRRMEKERVFD